MAADEGAGHCRRRSRRGFDQVKTHLLLGGALLAMASPQLASAQSVPSPFPSDLVVLFRDDVAGTRELPDAGEAGIDLATFRLRGGLGVTGAYDSNVLNLAGAGPGDFQLALRPSLGLASRWQQHAIGVYADANIVRHADITINNSESWRVGANGRLDAGVDTKLYFDGEAARGVDQRGAGGVLFPIAEPNAWRQDRIGAGIGTRFGDLNLSLAGGWLQRRYDAVAITGVGALRQDFRDVDTWSVTPRIGWQVSPRFDVFVRGQAGFTRSRLDDAALAALGTASRDADGYVVTAGVRGEITPLLIAEVAAGWQKRDFRVAAARDYDGITWNVTVDWYPTPLISARLTARQDFENSGLPTVPGILSRDVGLRLYYEVTRAVLASVELDWQNQRYRELGITTDTVIATARAEYRVNRHLSAALFIRHRGRGTNDPLVGSFAGTVVGLGLETRL
jgi:hypothetical protein